MKKAIKLLKSSPRYRKNVEYGLPRDGHPEGKIKFHIEDLEANLELLCGKDISEEEYWKLKFIIHIHDICKPEAQDNTPTLHPKNHATLAKQFASEFTNDTDILNTIQYHDENYELWKDYLKKGQYDFMRFENLLQTIKDWDLFLIFIIIDGCTKGKDYKKLSWFIREVKKYRKTKVSVDWVLDP